MTGDRKYGTEENLVAIEREHIHAYIPSPDVDYRTAFFSADRFRYEAERDVYLCPTARNCALIGRIQLSDSAAIAHGPKTATTYDISSAGLWPRSLFLC